jgi:DNA-binding transcriptional ArsR family regulator
MRLDEIAGNVVDITAKNVKPVRADKASSERKTTDHRNYIVVPIRAINDQRIHKTAAIVVLMLICSYTNRHGETWVGQQTLADRLKVSRQAVSKQLNRLIELGYLEVIKQGTRNFSTRYRVIFDPKLTFEQVKANTPAALREDAIEHKPASKESAIDRLSKMKSMLKGRDITQPPEVAQ